MIRERPPLATEQALAALEHGRLEILGRMPWSSNATFLVDVLPAPDAASSSPATHSSDPAAAASAAPDFPVQAIYKPVQGERPLWDFPEGLHQRERACFVLSEILGWRLVPPTVIRDGPLGEGSLQLFMLADFSEHYFSLKDQPQHQLALRQLCAFDIIANSTDRKSGHVLWCPGEACSQIFAIDNGLSFHTEFKLRTVLWDFTGQPLPDELSRDITKLLDSNSLESLAGLLSQPEMEAAKRRAETLLSNAVFPSDHTGHRWPWPLV